MQGQGLPSLGGLHRPSFGVGTPGGQDGIKTPGSSHPNVQTPGSSLRTSYYTTPFQPNAATGTPATTSTFTQPGAANQKQSLEDLLNNYQQNILNEALQRVNERTRSDTIKFLDDQVNKRYKNDRNEWLSGVLGRRVGDGELTTSAHRPSPVGLLTAPDYSIDVAPTANNAPNSWNRPHGLALHGSRQVPLDPALALENWKVVTNTTQPMDAVTAFKSLVARSESPIAKGYASALDLMANLLLANDVASPIDMATRTLVHFAQQFEQEMNRIVQAGFNSGAIHGASSFNQESAQLCDLFVSHTLGPDAGTWALLYYALRIGDAKAAFEIWTSRPPADISLTHKNAIESILAAWTPDTFRSDTRWMWEKGPLSISPADRGALQDLLGPQYAHNGVHFKGAIALLTGYDDLSIDSSTAGLRDLEDYIFGQLWKALLAESPVAALESFGRNMQQISPDYQNEQLGNWQCALLLLGSQQYSSAIMCLAHSGNDVLMQAAHLTIVLTTAGSAILDLGGPKNPAHNVAARVLEKYSSSLLSLPPMEETNPLKMALDYLLCIDNQVVCDKAIATLIVNQNFPFELVGSLSDEGVPNAYIPLQKSLGDNYPRFVAILSKAAELAASDMHDVAKVSTALKCYMLARKYDGVVSLLISLLSPPNELSENRQHWIGFAVEFFNNCIIPRGEVYFALENLGKIGLVDACEILIQLNRFFALLRSHQYDEAYQVVANSGLVPRTADDLQSVAATYRDNLDDSIRCCYPQVLSGFMDVLLQKHVDLKRSVRGGAEQVVKTQLAQLREQSSLVVQLAGLIDNDDVRRSQLSGKQALMI